MEIDSQLENFVQQVYSWVCLEQYVQQGKESELAKGKAGFM